MKNGDLVTEIEHTEVPGIQKFSKVCLSFIGRIHIYFLQIFEQKKKMIKKMFFNVS